jgi:hypothetical protein
MCLPPPWVFAAVGTLLAVGSAIVAKVITWRLERKEKELERKHADTMKVVQLRERASEGDIHYNLAQLKLSLAQLAQPPVFGEAAHSTLKAILLRNEAARNRMTEDERESLFGAVARASQGQVKAWKELAKTYDSLLEGYVEYYNEQVSLRDSLASQLDDIRRTVAGRRSLSVSLEILGLLIVLGKDLPQP